MPAWNGSSGGGASPAEVQTACSAAIAAANLASQASVNLRATQASVDLKASQASVDLKASQASLDAFSDAMLVDTNYGYTELTGGDSLVRLGVADTQIRVYQLVLTSSAIGGAAYQIGYSDNDGSNFVALGAGVTNLDTSNQGVAVPFGALTAKPTFTIPTGKAFSIISEGTLCVYHWTTQV